MAISPQVISAPSSLQILRKGRLPTVVKGARNNLSANFILDLRSGPTLPTKAGVEGGVTVELPFVVIVEDESG